MKNVEGATIVTEFGISALLPDEEALQNDLPSGSLPETPPPRTGAGGSGFRVCHGRRAIGNVRFACRMG